MRSKEIKSIAFIASEKRDKMVIDIANKLGVAEGRKPTDSIRRLILEEGSKKLSVLTNTHIT